MQIPDGLRCDEGANGLTITHRAPVRHAVIGLLACMFWNGGVTFMLTRPVHSQATLAMLLIVAIPLGVIGLIFVWVVLAAFLNTTTIHADPVSVRVHRGPLQMPGARVVPSHEIEQVYCVQTIQLGTPLQGRCDVNVKTFSRRKIRLLSEFEAAQAQFIEQELERYLNIVDRHVPGEARTTPSERAWTDVPIPCGVEFEQSAKELIITRRWRSPLAFALLYFCAGWNIYLIIGIAATLSQLSQGVSVIMPLWPLPIGIALTWVATAQFFNRTVIHVDHESLTVRHGPIPWRGIQCLPVDQIRQVCWGRASSLPPAPSLDLLTIGGRRIRLVSQLHDYAEAMFIYQALTRFLGLDDQHMPGQIKA